jgi:ATP-dependent Clp protease protease subunit
MLAADTGHTAERIHDDTQRDNFMDAEQAREYGLIDRVMEVRIPVNGRRVAGLG